MQEKKEAFQLYKEFRQSGVDDYDSSLCVMEMLFSKAAWRDANYFPETKEILKKFTVKFHQLNRKLKKRMTFLETSDEMGDVLSPKAKI